MKHYRVIERGEGDAREVVLQKAEKEEGTVTWKDNLVIPDPEDEVEGEIDKINSKIPDEASSDNQLATRDDVATSSATYRGSYNLVSDLGLTTAATEVDVAAALTTTVTIADNNDYANVQIPSSDLTPTEIVRTDRYKFDGTDWEFEYTVIPNVEVTTNKVTSISAQSTDTQYPSARCVYNIVGDFNSVLDEINGEVI